MRENVKMVYTRNVINRRPIYILVSVLAVVGSISMFVLTLSFEAELWEIIAFSFLPFLVIVAVFIGDLTSPMEVGVGPDGIQLVYKLGRKLNVSWKDVISLQPYRAPDFYHLKYYKEGRVSMCTLSKEPADNIQKALSGLWRVRST
jgi:hypothetical protein